VYWYRPAVQNSAYARQFFGSLSYSVVNANSPVMGILTTDAGSCECYAGYKSADCSVSANVVPETSLAWKYGLCDTRTMNCSHVIVYGDNFINSPNLTCHFQETKVC